MSAAEQASAIVTPILFRIAHAAGLGFPVTVTVIGANGTVAALRYTNSSGITVEEKLLADSGGEIVLPAFATFVDERCRHALVFTIADDHAVISKSLARRSS